MATAHKNSATVGALQAALAAEQVASYGYGVVGAHLIGQAFTLATADCVLHERARDALEAMITALGGVPAPAAVAYQLPGTIGSRAEVIGLAAELEQGVIAGYLGLVAVSDASLRTLAAKRMQQAAVRAARWGSAPAAFPGLASR
jgi:uncharacterized protein DUF4439